MLNLNPVLDPFAIQVDYIYLTHLY